MVEVESENKLRDDLQQFLHPFYPFITKESKEMECLNILKSKFYYLKIVIVVGNRNFLPQAVL